MRWMAVNGLNVKDQNTRNYFIVVMVISLVLSAFELIPYIIFQSNIPFLTKTVSFFLVGMLNFITVVASFLSNYAILRPFDRKNPAKRYLVFVAFLISFVIVSLFGFLNIFIVQPLSFGFARMILPRGFFISMVSTTYTYIARLNFQKQVFELENEILKKESIKGQYEALKNELSPHFLFNSLNALQNIIRENPGNAGQYVHHLSQVLRYTLQSSDNQIVTLQEELDLAESYIYLLEMRYENNLKFDINVPQEARSMKILPLTLLSLIENAVKHNEISSRFPLVLRMSINDKKFLVVTNNIQIKLTQETSLGIGLANLSQRYKILTGEDIMISKADNQFSVEVPLMES